MIDWKNWFKRPVVIEILAPLPVLDKEANEYIKTLQYHPGFLELMNRLKIQRAFLETRLKRDPAANMRDLQAAIYWNEFWERSVHELVHRHKLVVTQVHESDLTEEFNKINNAVERVSNKRQTTAE